MSKRTMQYRSFGKLDSKGSALGFGAMRLPCLDGNSDRIDELLAIRMIRHAIDRGVNYVDTAYPYHGGNSEVVVGKALRGGYRDRTMLATKMPVWKVEKREDFDSLFAEQLKRLGTDRVDFYLLHGLNQQSWPKVRGLGVMEWAENRRAKGDIRHIGFSFHDGPAVFIGIIDDYPWEFCQIQYNYMDTETQAGIAGLHHAAAKGLAVVVMEPLKGGKLARPPERVQAIFDRSPTQRTPPAWALHWVWHQPEVSLVLSGMSTMEQVRENLELAEASGIGSMTAGELAVIDEVRMAYQSEQAIGCTECRYCLPCQSGVNIPRNFALYNDGRRYDSFDEAQFIYRNWMKPEERAQACTACGLCEDKCPQKLPIRDLLAKVGQALKP